MLELVINSALIHFQEKEFEKAFALIEKATEICSNFRLMIPNLYLMKSFSEMQIGRLDESLKSINHELQFSPFNGCPIKLKGQIEVLKRG